nr:hypothetical protein [Tanacetum cinerariifolium]
MVIRDEMSLSKDDSLPKASSLRVSDQNKHRNKLPRVKGIGHVSPMKSKSKVTGKSDSPKSRWISMSERLLNKPGKPIDVIEKSTVDKESDKAPVVIEKSAVDEKDNPKVTSKAIRVPLVSSNKRKGMCHVGWGQDHMGRSWCSFWYCSGGLECTGVSVGEGTPKLRPGYLALNDSLIFLDNEGGSLANSFSVVEGKYSLPDLVSNCLKSFKNDYRIICLTCDVIFCGSSVISSRVEYASGNTVRHYSHLDITSDHRPGSAGKTSITPDYVHADGRVH